MVDQGRESAYLTLVPERTGTKRHAQATPHPP